MGYFLFMKSLIIFNHSPLQKMNSFCIIWFFHYLIFPSNRGSFRSARHKRFDGPVFICLICPPFLPSSSIYCATAKKEGKERTKQMKDWRFLSYLSIDSLQRPIHFFHIKETKSGWRSRWRES